MGTSAPLKWHVATGVDYKAHKQKCVLLPNFIREKSDFFPSLYTYACPVLANLHLKLFYVCSLYWTTEQTYRCTRDKNIKIGMLKYRVCRHMVLYVLLKCLPFRILCWISSVLVWSVAVLVVPFSLFLYRYECNNIRYKEKKNEETV